MRHLQFDRQLAQFDAAELTTLVSTTGLLEDSWAHRQNWRLGHPERIDSRRHPGRLAAGRHAGLAPIGKLIVFNERFAYGVLNPYTWLKQTRELHPPSHDGHLHQKYSRYEAEDFPIGARIYAKQPKSSAAPAGKNRRKRKASAGSDADYAWVIDAPLQPRAMVLADHLLFVAGWLDAVAVQEETGRPINAADPDPRPAVLRALRADDGKTIAEYKLDCEPVFDGMSAANRRLYVCLKDGTVQCLGNQR
jgi:hypothetical protein